MLEKAPESEFGGNARYSHTGFRFVYDGGREIRDFIDVDDAKFANFVMPPYTRENFLADLNRVTEGRIDQELANFLVDNSNAAVRWMHKAGIKFEHEKPVPVKPRYRGFHRFDLTTCIGCDKCARACPVDCIYIDKEKNPMGKGFRVNGFKIDYGKCIFCALCVDPCPVDCLYMGSNYDLSGYSRDGLIVDLAKLPLEVAWGQNTLNPTVVAASKHLTSPVWTKPPEPPKPSPPPKPTP